MRWSSVLAGCALLLAGCSGGAGSDDPIVVGASVADAASVVGVVVDDSHAPIPQAQVALLEAGLQTVTDEAGAFRFADVAPGTYVLQAGRIGYDGTAQKVTVEADGEHQVILTLTALAIVEPYQETFGPFSGYFECQVGTPVFITPCTGDTVHDVDLNSILFPGDRRRLHFNLSSDEWQTMVGEARWPRTSVATSQGMAAYPSYSKRATNHWWCEADGTSPIQFRLEKDGESSCVSTGQTDPEPSMEVNPLVLVADPGFGGTSTTNPPLRLILQQRFELLMTVFYHEPGPVEYSGFPDT